MKNQTFFIILAGLTAASVLFWAYLFQSGSNNDTPILNGGEAEVIMYHGEGCMCCVRWADYLENQGFTVISKKVADLFEVKDEYGVPYEINSCHTAIVDGYVVEGHVPAEDIRRLLAERPEAIGISVPGMPPSAPGMDAPVSRPYETLLFDSEDVTVFNTHE